MVYETYYHTKKRGKQHMITEDIPTVYDDLKQIIEDDDELEYYFTIKQQGSYSDT